MALVKLLVLSVFLFGTLMIVYRGVAHVVSALQHVLFGTLALVCEHRLTVCTTLVTILLARWRRLVAMASVRADAAAASLNAKAASEASRKAASETAALQRELAAIKATRVSRRTSLDPPATWGQGDRSWSLAQPPQPIRLCSTSS